MDQTPRKLLKLKLKLELGDRLQGSIKFELRSYAMRSKRKRRGTFARFLTHARDNHQFGNFGPSSPSPSPSPSPTSSFGLGSVMW
jgi:hypothetical protein